MTSDQVSLFVAFWSAAVTVLASAWYFFVLFRRQEYGSDISGTIFLAIFGVNIRNGLTSAGSGWLLYVFIAFGIIVTATSIAQRKFLLAFSAAAAGIWAALSWLHQPDWLIIVAACAYVTSGSVFVGRWAQAIFSNPSQQAP